MLAVTRNIITVPNVPKTQLQNTVIDSGSWFRMSQSQKRSLLNTRSSDPTVAIQTRISPGNGTALSEIAISNVSAKMLAAFSGVLHSQLLDSGHQTVMLRTVHKHEVIRLVRWMSEACTTLTPQSFDMLELDVPTFARLFDVVEELDLVMPREVILRELEAYVMACVPCELLELAEYNLRLPYDRRMPGLKPMFNKYLSQCEGSDLLVLWKNVRPGFEQSLAKPIRHHLHQLIWNTRLRLDDLQSIWDADPSASFTKVAVKNVVGQLWARAPRTTKEMPDLGDVSKDLRHQIEKTWQDRLDAWEGRSRDDETDQKDGERSVGKLAQAQRNDRGSTPAKAKKSTTKSSLMPKASTKADYATVVKPKTHVRAKES